jgi:hypothetical protein
VPVGGIENPEIRQNSGEIRRISMENLAGISVKFFFNLSGSFSGFLKFLIKI